MKKLMLAIAMVAILGVAVYMGMKYFVHSSRPDLNGNEKILSTALDQDGKPTKILGQVTEVTVTKDMEEIYLSIPVNNKSMKDCKVTLNYENQIIEEQKVVVSKAGYVTYHLEHLKDLESGLYQFAFYDSNDEINVYAALTIE